MSRAIDGEPNFADEEFESLAELLVHDAEPGISQREWLPKQALDYSLESLKALDEYLEVLHAWSPKGEDLGRVVLRCGAYVGEVMRRCSPNTYHWVTFAEASRCAPLGGLELSVGTYGILWRKGELFFPLGKVWKFLANGSEDSVHFFARALLHLESDLSKSSHRRASAWEIRERIRRLLREKWDPIGVGLTAFAQDEYDSYVEDVHKLVAQGAPPASVSQLLIQFEQGLMGLSGDKDRLPLARELCALGRLQADSKDEP